MSDGLPTPRQYLNVHTVHSICTRCDRWVKLDLAALVAAGYGDTPPVKLPLRCSQCGKTGHEIKVSGQSYGLEAGPGHKSAGDQSVRVGRWRYRIVALPNRR